MRRSLEVVIGLIAVVCIGVAAAQTEDPVLVSANIPFYPPLARQARVYGTVKVAFALPANSGEPARLEAVSGHPILKSAAMENVKTWRFRNTSAVERKYETTFHYALTESESPHVTFSNFADVEIVSLKPPPLDSNF